MRRYLWLFSVILSIQFTQVYADANERFIGSYFCTADAVGGVRFNEGTDKWESYRFSAASKYIINISANMEVKDTYDDKVRQTYFITFSEHGSSTDNITTKCFTNSNQLRELNPISHFISDNGFFSCRLWVGELKVSLENGRFLKTYSSGYVDGVNNNDNTPHVEIGTCSKLN